MKQFLRTSVIGVSLLLIVVAAGFGQGWPRPAKTPNTDVPCTSGTATGCGKTLATIGYPSPSMSGYTGRFLDSNAMTQFRTTFRTARAWYGMYVPQTNRIYLKIGSAVASYDANTFMSRLAGGEALMSASSAPVSPGNTHDGFGAPFEVFLSFDSFFYAEFEPANGWDTCGYLCPDSYGDDVLGGFDVDDRNYVYVAYKQFGWGLAKDTFSGLMDSHRADGTAFQVQDGNVAASAIAWVKGSNGHYYALVTDSSSTYIADVTDPNNGPQPISTQGRGFISSARTAAADRIAFIDATNALKIYTSDALVRGGAPIFTGTAGSAYSGTISSDGTNFFAATVDGSSISISVISPSGSGYTENRYPQRYTGIPMSTHVGDGFLAVSGYLAGGWGVRLYKFQNLQPVEIPVDVTKGGVSRNYFQAYYSTAFTGYAVPSGAYMNIYDSLVVRGGDGRDHVIVCAKGLGDVYEIIGGNSISITSQSVVGQVNSNAPASTGPFYGDKLQFIASAATQQANVQWDFGNPETAVDPNTASGVTGTPITHQYSGLTTSNVGNSRTVTATNANDASLVGSTVVQLKTPAARFGISGTALLFTLPNASSTAPIVVGDNFFDGSDGTVEGHFDTWNIGGVVTRALPGDLVPVGACGTQSLSFDGHYGPFTGTAGNYTPVGTDFAVGVHGSGYDFVYSVKPYAALVTTSSDSTNVTFSSVSRFGANQPTAGLTYFWELVGSNKQPLQNGPTASGTLGTTGIPPFVVLKSLFSGSALSAHLVINSPTPLAGSCAGYEKSELYTTSIIGPDPAIAGGCTSGGPPCSFTANSSGGQDVIAQGWTYQWSVSGLPTPTFSSSTSRTFTPTFTALGTYTLNLTVTNGVGFTASAQPLQVTVTTLPPVCPTMTDTNTFLNFSGSASSCNPTVPSCTTSDTVSFSLGVNGYRTSCGPHTYAWDLGDGTTSSSATISHKFAAGTWPVQLTVNNGTNTETLKQTITVGGNQCTGPCGCNACPPPPCGTMNGNDVFDVFSGATSGCSQATGTCKGGETISFAVSSVAPYNLNCASHTFLWDFGDGGSGIGQSANHVFQSGGTYTVKCTVSNGTQSFDAIVSVPVVAGPPPVCTTMNSSSVAIGYNGAISHCGSGGTSCQTSESVGFTAAGSYDYSCDANTTYAWDFGDSSTGTGSAPHHAYPAAGTYSVTLKVQSSTQSTTVSQSVTVIAVGRCPVMSQSSVFIDYSNAANTCNPYDIHAVCQTSDVLNYDAKGSQYNFGCGPHTFAWDLGDGTTANTKQVTHQYGAAGTYPIKLTVNNGTNTVTVTASIVVTGIGVINIPDVDFTVSPMASVPNGFVFTPIANPAGIITKWVWDFGDGATKTVNSPTADTQPYLYATGGVHTVILTVFDSQNRQLKQVTHTFGLTERKRLAPH